MTLVRGHGYPTQDIANGFEWKFDEINNGKMLNCYPDLIIDENLALLKAIIE